MSTNVTISQALRRIKKLKGEIAEHQARASSSSYWVSDKPPTYNFHQELKLLDECRKEMLDLESRVAVANATNKVIFSSGIYDSGEITLTELIRKLQEIKGEIAWHKSLNLRSGVEKSREPDWDDNLNKSIIRVVEITYVSAMTEQERDGRVKWLQDTFEELNNLLEDSNHKVTV